MGTVRLGNFPSLNNKGLQDDIAKSFVKWFMNRFPINFFNHVFIDTQVSNANSYIVNQYTGELQKYESGQKILQPSLRVNIKQGSNNLSDVFGSLWNVNQQPGAFSIDTDLTGYKPFLYDPYGSILATNDYTIRNQIEIVIQLQTKADQLAFYNMCDSNLKNMYVNTITSDVGVILPSLMLEYIRQCVFKPEYIALNKMNADSVEKSQYRTKINEKFTEYLYNFSNKCIKPITEQESETGVKNYLYKLFRKQLITFHLDKVDGDDGQRKGGVYTGFNVSINGYMEYANPISFVTSIPAIIRGLKNDYFIKTSSNTDNKGNYHIMEFKEVFKDDRHLVIVDGNIYKHFYFERELMMASATEKFNILDDIIVKDDTPSHYYIMRALLSLIKDKDAFDALFRVIIYKNNEPLDKKYYTIDEKFNFTVKECDLSVPYYIDVWIHKYLYDNYISNIISELSRIGVVISNNEVYSHFSKYNWQIYDPFYSEIFKENAQDSLRNYDPIYSPNSKERAYYYLTQTYNGEESEGNEIKTFIPIKTKDFLTAPKNENFYVISVDGVMIAVKNEVIENRIDLDYYIKDPDGEYIKIDRNKVLVPDPDYKYYIFDRNDRKYKLCSGISKFEDDVQYYILQDQHHSSIINTYDSYENI